MQETRKYRPLPKGARVIEKEGIKYVSVTTVLSGIYPIAFPEYQLRQYAARGYIVHAQVKHFLRTGVWEQDLLKIPFTEEEMLRMCQDLQTVSRGSLQLTWKDCNFLGFLEKYGKDFKPWKGGCGDDICFNEQFRYVATPDWPCLYRDEPAIADIKTSSHYPEFRVNKFKKQTAAYAKSYGNGEAKQTVIIPLNPANKCGFGKPIVEKDVDIYFKYFVKDRQIFRQVYGL